MKTDLTIREKLMLYYVLLGIVAIVGVGVYSFFRAREAILDRAFEQLTSVREVKKDRIEGFFEDRVREVTFLAQSSDLAEIVHNPRHSVTTKAKKAFQSFLKNGNYYSVCAIAYDSTQYTYIHVNNDSAQTHSSIPSITHILSCIDSVKSTYVFDYMHWNNELVMPIATPIDYENGNNTATLILGIPLSAINDIMLEDNTFGGLGQSGESYVVGKDYLLRSSSRFQENSVLHTYVNTEGVVNAFSENFGTKIIQDYRDITVLSSHSIVHFHHFDWAILAEIDFKEVMIPVYAIRNDIIVISGFIIILLCIVAFVISQKITRPLLSLRNLALEIAHGTYGKTMAIETNDEVGELTEAFNTMSVQIQEKTKELREREKRLNHFYKATTDGIIFHNRGKLVLVNQAMYEITGYSHNEIMELTMFDLIKITDIDKYLNHPNSSFVFETECITKTGTRFPIEVIENPIEYDGSIISASVIRDISERKESQRKLQAERSKQINSFLDGQEDERKRLSRELHDGIGQSLIGIKMRLDMLKLNDEPKNIETLSLAKEFVNHTIQEIRRVSNNLLPSVLQDIGLKLAIEKLCSDTQKNADISIHFDLESLTKINNDKIKTYLYRITQEAIHNAVKHSKASEMTIMVLQESSKVRLIIEDNGVGFDIESLTERGNGLYYMQERAAILGGEITISSSKGNGTYIDVRIPLPNTNTQ